MRILFLNWRDSRNPEAGGAETFTEEIGRRLALASDEVTIFTSMYDRGDREESRLGIRIIRGGGRYTVYSEARKYLKQHQSDFDIVVDEINTIPFRAHKILKGPRVVAVIHQLAREIWFYETRFPVNAIGYYILEPFWLRSYKRIPTVTVSESTRADLLKRGFCNVQVIQNGIGVTPLQKPAVKNPNPVLLFLGRLVRSKFPDHAIEAFKQVKASMPDAELWVLGDGYLRHKLEQRKVAGVRFFGRVSQEQKYDLLKRAHVLLAPSIREGWGIGVIEANAMGTPAVGYSVAGLQDSIVHGLTGLLVRPLSIQAMAEAALDILCDPVSAGRLAQNAIEWSRRFTWDQAAKQFHDFLSIAVGCQNE